MIDVSGPARLSARRHNQHALEMQLLAKSTTFRPLDNGIWLDLITILHVGPYGPIDNASSEKR